MQSVLSRWPSSSIFSCVPERCYCLGTETVKSFYCSLMVIQYYEQFRLLNTLMGNLWESILRKRDRSQFMGRTIDICFQTAE